MALTSLSSKKIRLLHVSDVHVFHPKNDTLSVLDKLRRLIFRKDVNIIMLGGDFFDNLGSLAGEPVWPVFHFAAELLKHCQQNDILLRVLKGTPSHDWNQNRIFQMMSVVTKTQAVIKLVNDISIEYIERYGINVLYIPDEARPTTSITYGEVTSLMAKHQLEKVDVCLMHGTFDYQMPLAPDQVHDSEAFNKIVKYFTSVGHIHQKSQKGNILAQGSFDRNSHGDEVPKGFFISTIDLVSEVWTTEFVENTDAKIFKTIDLSGMTTEAAVRKCAKLLVGIVDGSYIRYKAESSSPVYQGMAALQEAFPQFQWSKKSTDAVARKQVELEFTAIYTAVKLTPDNLGGLLKERVIAKHGFAYSDAVLSRVIDKHL